MSHVCAQVITKVIRACSCLVRESPEMLAEFTALDGVSQIVAVLQRVVDENVVTKTCFFLRHLVQLPDAGRIIGAIDLFVSLIGSSLECF